MKNLYMTIYCDSTGLFSESECNVDNLTEMIFPEEIVRKWFDDQQEKEYIWTGYEFENWMNEYTADDTDGLYEFAIKNGYKPVFGVDGKDTVFYRDDWNFKTIIFEGTYDECRYFGKENDWEYTTEDGEIYELEVWSES